MNTIILFKEKHGELCFDASTDELTFAACLNVVKRRLKDGWYQVPNKPKKPHFDEKEIAAMPWEERAVLTGLFQMYKSSLEWFNLSKQDRETAIRASENNDGKLAWKLIDSRRGYEYEGFEMIEVLTA
jgi:hypothetical protein